MNTIIMITIKEAAELMNVSETQVRKLIKNGTLSKVKKNVTKVYKEEVLEYMAMLEDSKNPCENRWNLVYEQDESFRPLDSYVNFCGIITPTSFSFNPGYWVSNKGNVYNAKYNRMRKAEPVSHEYLQVVLYHNGKRIPEMLHRIVALVWCPNGKYKLYVHHIDNNKNNNAAENLIWMTEEEHILAHKLLNSDPTAYADYIAKIRKDNEWTEKIRWIVHPDYESDVNHHYYLYLTEEGFQKHIVGLDFSNAEIRGEIACCSGEGF